MHFLLKNFPFHWMIICTIIDSSSLFFTSTQHTEKLSSFNFLRILPHHRHWHAYRQIESIVLKKKVKQNKIEERMEKLFMVIGRVCVCNKHRAMWRFGISLTHISEHQRRRRKIKNYSPVGIFMALHFICIRHIFLLNHQLVFRVAAIIIWCMCVTV